MSVRFLYLKLLRNLVLCISTISIFQWQEEQTDIEYDQKEESKDGDERECTNIPALICCIIFVVLTVSLLSHEKPQTKLTHFRSHSLDIVDMQSKQTGRC